MVTGSPEDSAEVPLQVFTKSKLAASDVTPLLVLAKLQTVRAFQILFVLCGSQLVCSLPGHAAGEQCLQIIQNSQAHGIHTVTISKNAVKIVGKTSEYTILMKAPEWKVVTYSTSHKSFHEATADKWTTPLGDAYTIMTRVRFENCKVIDKGKKQFLSFSCKCFAVNPEGKLRNNADKEKDTATVVKDAELLTCETIAVAPQVSSVLCKFSGLPKVKGVPIRFVCKNEVRHEEVFLTTLYAKKLTIPSSEFSMPKGLKLAKSSREVVMDSSKDFMIQNIVDGLGDSIEKPRK